MKCKIAGVIILIIMLNSIILSGCSKVNKGNTNKSEPGNMSSDALSLESTKNTTENEKQSTSRNSEEDYAITNDPKYLNFDYAEDIPDEEWNVDKNTIIWAFFDDIGIFGNVEEHINEKLEKDGYPFKIKCIVLGKKEYTQRVKDCRADIIFDGLGFPDSTYKWSVMHDAILEGKILKLDEYLSGSRLYDFFPEAMWESIRVDGSLYSIPNTNFYDSSLAVVFKKSAYTEEEIESFDNTLDGLLKLVDPNRKLYLWDSDCWTGYLDMYGIQNYEDYGIYYEDDEIKNLMDLDINIRWIKELHNLAEQGMLINGKNIVYQECKDDWSVALLNIGIKPDLDENEYYVVKYKGDMYPRYGGAIAIRENSHNPEYAFKLLELLLTDSEYGNLIVYGENVTEKDGYAVDPDTGKTIYSWNRRLQWGINDGILKGTSDDRCTFSSPEERKTYYKTYFREAATSYYGYYELCKGLGDLFQKHNNIIFKKGDIDEELNEWIKEANEIFEKYGP